MKTLKLSSDRGQEALTEGSGTQLLQLLCCTVALLLLSNGLDEHHQMCVHSFKLAVKQQMIGSGRSRQGYRSRLGEMIGGIDKSTPARGRMLLSSSNKDALASNS